MAVSFDLFGTLVTTTRPSEPWEAVADELQSRGVDVPPDWESAYRSTHIECDPLAELSLVDHVQAALASRSVHVSRDVTRSALLDAFSGPVSVRTGASSALRSAAVEGGVGILTNCSLPGLVDRTLEAATLGVEPDAVVTSVGCGWRKPHDRAFETVAERLCIGVDQLVHVGDDPRCDGGGRTAGVTVVLIDDVPLADFPTWLEDSL